MAQAKAGRTVAPSSTRRPRGSLSGEEILAAAYELVEHDGLDALSMPILARHLGAGVTSIYWYFRNKEHLLIALAEQVTRDVYERVPAIGHGPWDEELRKYFRRYRRELRRVPVYLELFSLRPRFILSRPGIFPIVMHRLEQEVGALVVAGLTPVEAARAYTACSVYARGFVTLEQGQKHEIEELDETVHRDLIDQVERLDAAAFPILRRLGDLERVTVLNDKQFNLGLDLVLDGIRAEIERRKAPKPRKRAPRRRAER